MRKRYIVGLVLLGVVVLLVLGKIFEPDGERRERKFGLGMDCVSNTKPVFTHDITEVGKIGYIVPPGNVEGYGDAGSVFKTHSYIKGPNKVPMYAPADGKLFRGIYVNEGGIAQYGLFFNASCEIYYLFDHVVDPPEKIAAVFSKMVYHTNEMEEFKNGPEVKAGELVGYSIGERFEQWDFGVYDRTQEREYPEVEKQAEVYERDKQAVCPYDFFPAEKRKFYYSKFMSHISKDIPR